MQTIIRFFKTIFLVDLLKGMWVTMKYTPQPAFTFQYPAERRPTAPRFRGVLRLQVEPSRGSRGGALQVGFPVGADVHLRRRGEPLPSRRCHAGVAGRRCPVSAWHAALFGGPVSRVPRSLSERPEVTGHAASARSPSRGG